MSNYIVNNHLLRAPVCMMIDLFPETEASDLVRKCVVFPFYWHGHDSDELAFPHRVGNPTVLGSNYTVRRSVQT